MATITIDVDTDDALDDLSDSALRAELKRRSAHAGAAHLSWTTDAAALVWTAAALADDLRSAFYARDANRFDALLYRIEPMLTALHDE